MVCKYEDVNCDDFDDCTIDSCDPYRSGCVHTHCNSKNLGFSVNECPAQCQIKKEIKNLL